MPRPNDGARSTRSDVTNRFWERCRNRLWSKQRCPSPLATLALGQIGPDAKLAIPNLIRQLQKFNNTPCQKALVSIGPDAVGPLLEALDDKNAQISFQAYQTLGQMGASVVEPLRKVLTNPCGYRWGAANALGMIGPNAKSAVPDLVKALGDKEGGLETWSGLGPG